MHIALEGCEGAGELDSSLVRARATTLLTQGGGALFWSSEPPLAAVPTLGLVKLIKEAVEELFEQHREAVHASCGEPIDKQCALGFAIGDALGQELLAAEALRIGKAAAALLVAAKKKDDTLKGNAAAKRTRARKAANAANQLDKLDATIAAIDSHRDEQRAALWGAPAKLPIPTAPLVQTRERPLPRPQPNPVVDELAAARAALTAALEAQSNSSRARS